MSAPHSLPFSNASSSQPTVISKRHSHPSQLPLPSGLSAPATQRPHVGNIRTGNIGVAAAPNSPPIHSQFPSSVPVPSRADPSVSSAPSVTTFPPPHLTHSSSTHAGGIQPSASFFHPSRPSQQYSRPPSPSLTHKGAPIQESDLYPLAPLPRPSNSSDGEPGSTGGGPESTLDDDYRQFTSLQRTQKKSREPLLPLSGGPAPFSSRPSVHRERTGTSSVATSGLTSRGTTSRLVRSSLDKVRNLRRGLSFESAHRSPNSHPPLHTDRHPLVEGKQMDEEQGIFHRTASPTSRYKESSSPDPMSQALNVTAMRHSLANTTSPSPDPSFIPTSPQREYPLSAAPIIDPNTRKPVRNYQRHLSRNKFFFGGRLLTGGDSPWAFVASLLLMFAITGVWFGTTCVWWWQNKSPAVASVGAYLALITITSMLVTATCDPGILPRNLDPDPPYPATSPSDGGLRAPMPRDLKVRSDVVRVKYCTTCKTYRPPRSSHCKMCDNCVDGCDHHCQWVNNCVGRRNYTSFFVLLLSATTTLILVICTSAFHLYFLTDESPSSFKHALREGAGSAVAFCLAIAVIWPVAALLTYHMRLLLLNITTIEQIRNQAHKTLVAEPPPPNPFSHGNWRRNLIAVLCRPVGYSWLDGAGVATEDKREINPGMTEHVWDGPRDCGENS